MEPFRFLVEFGFKGFFFAGFLDVENYGRDFWISAGFLLDFLDFCRVYEDFCVKCPSKEHHSYWFKHS